MKEEGAREETPKAVEKAPEKPARPAAAAMGEAPSRDGKVWVHAAALGAEKADSLARKLTEKGYPTDVSPIEGKPNLFRIRIGPYADRAKAEAAVKKLKSEKWQFQPEVHSVKP